MFRSKRSSIGRRLWKLRTHSGGCDEARCAVEKSSNCVEDVRSVVQCLLKRLSEVQLDMLLRSVESRGTDDAGCILVPRGELRRHPHVLCCQIWRWHDLQQDYELKRLHCCESDNDAVYVCCNPYHWSRLQIPDQINVDPVSGRTEETNYHYGSLYIQSSAGSSMTMSGAGKSWCTLAYWELKTRVGRLYPVQKSSVNVFGDLPHGEGLCLGALTEYHKAKSDGVARTRDKIGPGLTLTNEGNEVWLYNRSKSSIFVNSPTLDPPNTRTLTVYKVQQGYSIKIFDFQKSRYYQALESRGECEVVNPDGPFDPNAVRISFAKGWGTKYSRQFVTSCPCWLEVFLSSPR